MPHIKLNREIPDPRWKTLCKLGGVAAWMVVVLFLTAIPDFITKGVLPDNFLVIIFKLHAGFSGIQEGALDNLNLLDSAILILTGVMLLALYPALKRVRRVWTYIAVALPFIGQALFIITHGIGRSSIMGAGLIVAVLMLSSDAFSKITAYTGLLANVFLLVGDIGTAFTYSAGFAVAICVGYLLLIVWCSLIGWRLSQMGWCSRPEGTFVINDR